MPNYQKMYSILFNGIADAIEQLQRIQIKTEELYMDSEEAPVSITKRTGADMGSRGGASGGESGFVIK